MMMRRLDDLGRDLLLHVNAPAEIQLIVLRQAARDFLARTEAWLDTLPSIDLVADTADYTLTHQYPAHIRRVTAVRILSEQDVTDGNEGTLQNPEYYEMVLPDILRLDTAIIPGEDVTDGLSVDAVLVPNMNCQELPVDLLERSQEGIVARALYLLMIQPGKPWTAYDLATIHMRRYADLVSSAMGDLARRYTSDGGLQA